MANMLNISEEEYWMLKNEAEKFHMQGFAARKKGDYWEAIELYSKALSILPIHFKALFNRGFAYDKIGDFDNAILDYSWAIELDDKNNIEGFDSSNRQGHKGLQEIQCNRKVHGLQLMIERRIKITLTFFIFNNFKLVIW